VDILLSILPELVVLVTAVAVAVARTTDNSLDDKVARLARDNQKQITGAIRDLVRDEKPKR